MPTSEFLFRTLKNKVHTVFTILDIHSMRNILSQLQKMSTITRPDVASMRISYDQGELIESTISLNPFTQFETWFTETKRDIPPPFEANAMCLSTATKEGRPSARIVLLKDYTEEGFVFFSNYGSRKGMQMDENPFAGNNIIILLITLLFYE